VFGQLGHGEEKDEPAPRVIEFFKDHRVKSLVSSGSRYRPRHPCVLSTPVFRAVGGAQGRCRHCGRTLPRVRTYHPVLCSNATAAVTEDGELFTFGCARDGRLGHPVGIDAPNEVQYDARALGWGGVGGGGGMAVEVYDCFQQRVVGRIHGS
jgi:hypothetical protein